MAISRKQVRLDQLPHAIPPIKYLTENGFSIVRLSEVSPSEIDTPGECRFLVQREDGPERDVIVAFGETLTTLLQIRRRTPLAETSAFWLVCAELCLANYLWENDHYPPDERLMIDELPPDELMLALHWKDGE
jgi:hypothetical protein